MGTWGDTFGGAEREPVTTPERRTSRQLARATDDVVWRGVCAGVARFVGTEPLYVRLATIGLAGLVGIEILLLYIAARFILPVDRSGYRRPQVEHNKGAWLLAAFVGSAAIGQIFDQSDSRILLAIALVAVGVNLLRDRREGAPEAA